LLGIPLGVFIGKQSPNPVVRGEAAGATTAGWKNLK
jgi:hypothetical protein